MSCGNILVAELSPLFQTFGSLLNILGDRSAKIGFIEVLEDMLENNSLVGIIQVVPFHPEFVFQGSDAGAVDNFTNRSPFPIVHILREDEVSRAVDSIGGDSSIIWKRNVQLLNNLEKCMGRERMEKLIRCDNK